jgi:hypothetical protein
MLWDSDFGMAFRYFFGPVPLDGLTDTPAGWVSWMGLLQAYRQMHYTAPAYGGIGYSVGAATGTSVWCGGLQRFFSKLD